MPSCKRKWTGRLAVLAWSILAVLLTPLPAAAQLAPVMGTHYAARSSDTGFQGAVNSLGGYGASVPLDLPAARGGLPVPVQIVYGGHRVGAAGLGWDLPLSYIFRDTTIARRRPANLADGSPQAREQISLMLDGQRIDLVRNAADTAWVARRNDAQLEVRDRGDGIMFMYDGEGRTYTFSAQGPGAGTRLVGENLFLLVGISAPGGNSVNFIYQFNAPALPGGGSGLAIDLLHVRFNKSPTTAGCFKNDVLFSYDLPAAPPLSILMLENTPLVRVRKISKVTVFSRPSCTDPDVALRTYTFNYQPDPDTQLPRLQSVTMNGQKNTPEQNIALPVAAYTYGKLTGTDGKIAFQKTQSITLPRLAPPVITFGLSYTSAFPVPATNGLQFRLISPQKLIDLNGDGRPDLESELGVFRIYLATMERPHSPCRHHPD